MNSLKSYGILLFGLALLVRLTPLAGSGSNIQQQAQDDSIRVDALIVLDTLDLKIHGPSNDLAFYMNGLVFLSNSKYHQKMLPEHITFGQVQTYFVPLEYIAIESSRPLFKNDAFPYSPGGMSFSRDYQTVYFTKPLLMSGRRSVEKIFETSIINSEVSPPRQLAFCNDPSQYMHPAVSEDGSFMIFSSDRVPSIGELDLFIVRKESGGWGQPENLGRAINTPGHEWFPFLDHHHNLYFSSSGHMGFGGYDIYVCPFNGSNWDEPLNLTDLINTTGDELAFSIHPNRRQVVYSSTARTDPSRNLEFTMKLNAGALLVAGVEESKSRDISMLIQDLVTSGYTSAEYGGIVEIEEPDAPLVIHVEPLLSEQEPEPEIEPVQLEPEPEPEPVQLEPEPEPEPVQLEPVQLEPEPEPEPEPVQLEPEPEPEPVQIQPEPTDVVFRVQCISKPRANTMPEIIIDGTRYTTFEYYYKGAYRITVGGFSTIQEALALRTKCKNAGYSQAFVAAFRGNERELDPSVFKR